MPCEAVAVVAAAVVVEAAAVDSPCLLLTALYSAKFWRRTPAKVFSCWMRLATRMELSSYACLTLEPISVVVLGVPTSVRQAGAGESASTYCAILNPYAMVRVWVWAWASDHATCC